MILSHEKNAVKKALRCYMLMIANGMGDEGDQANLKIIKNVNERLEIEHLPIGGFCFGDYKSHAEENGYNLTDEQVNDFMKRSYRLFDAGIGISWEVISIHLDIWAEEENIKPGLDKEDED